ncbi:ATP-binding protein (plasmid) [Niallia circulans]|uniref:histidine kinase n=1 Tax=Niallia circulans TaxID=1397 RepID=A0A553SQF1_NIACI|nr:ATP-binding protein [Niallia circulans]TRZ39223.1 ATP-binding protein [Niallia circulans]
MILKNLLSHNPEGTQIELEVSKGDMSEIKIKDNGIGMDEEVISRIFDRYYRGTSTGTLSGGAGLGMAIVKQIIKGH